MPPKDAAAAEARHPPKFEEILLSKKLLTDQQFSKAKKLQQENGRTILEAVNELGFLPADELLEFASRELNVPFLRLSKLKISPQIISLLPKKLAYLYLALPISKIKEVLVVAMGDPTNALAREDLKKATNFEIMPVLVSSKEILDILDGHYTEDTSEKLKDVVRNMEVDMAVVEDKKDDLMTSVSELMSLTQEQPVVKLTDHILNEGVRRRASDIFIEPQEKDLVIRYRVDGTLQEGPRPPRTMHRGIISRIKIMTSLNIAEQRLPQDGRCKLKIQSRVVDFRVSLVPTYFGEKACLRILDSGQARLEIKNLGFDEKSMKSLMDGSTHPYGMILTCGPTGSGKTTTLYSILSELNNVERNIITVEDPVEYAIHGINQVNARAEVGLTFAAALRSMLRQDPDVILVGEIRDNETADIAVKAALTGHLVLSTLHTNTAIGCIIRLVNMGVEPFLITSSLLLAASQRLIRKLCGECKESFEPTDEQKKFLGIREGKEKEKAAYFKPKGCPRCNNSGYSGRICIIEVLTLTPKIKDLIMKKAAEKEIKKAARGEGMMTLRENAVLKLRQGTTSAEEVVRVTAADEADDKP